MDHNGSRSAGRGRAQHGIRRMPLPEEVQARNVLKMLAAAEIATGGVLLRPIVPNGLAGAVLTAFSGGLLRTAEGYVEHILAKLGFTSRAQAAVRAAERRAHRGSD
jgi:hypothetical protein